MRILLHTMATPELSPLEALDLAARLRLDGLELVCQADYRCGLEPRAGLAEARRLAAEAQARGLTVAALSPYESRIDAADPAVRDLALDELRWAVVLAGALRAPIMRILAGQEPPPGEAGAAFGRLVEGLISLADHALGHGVALCIENHHRTQAISARQTARICAAIGRPNVGIIFDPANLLDLGAEDFPLSLELQAPWVRHVHVKDAIWVTAKPPPSGLASASPPPRGLRRAMVPGEGALPWGAILEALVAAGYAEALSLEHERRWRPHELAPAAEALPRARDFLRSCLNQTRPRGAPSGDSQG